MIHQDSAVVPLNDLVPLDRNPRRGDVGLIAESLERNGQYRPLVVRRATSEVLAGNHTLAAARQLGWSEIAVNYVDVDDEGARRIILVDNRSNDVASYDVATLEDILDSLPDLTGTGFTPEDLRGGDEDDWAAAMSGVAHGDPSHVTRTFTFPAELVGAVDEAVALEKGEDREPGANGRALARICARHLEAVDVEAGRG